MPAQITSKSNEGGTISYECPWCARDSMSHVRLLQQITVDTRLKLYMAGGCSHGDCGAPVLFSTDTEARGIVWGGITEGLAKGLALRTIPAPRPMYTAPDVPQKVREAMNEAYGCEAEGFIIGAAVVGRRALQLAVREKLGRREPTLQQEIHALPDDILMPSLKSAADQVRLIGNDAAHDDIGVTAEDVERLFLFTDAALQQLFILPAQLAAAVGVRPSQPRRRR